MSCHSQDLLHSMVEHADSCFVAHFLVQAQSLGTFKSRIFTVLGSSYTCQADSLVGPPLRIKPNADVERLATSSPPVSPPVSSLNPAIRSTAAGASIVSTIGDRGKLLPARYR